MPLLQCGLRRAWGTTFFTSLSPRRGLTRQDDRMRWRVGPPRADWALGNNRLFDRATDSSYELIRLMNRRPRGRAVHPATQHRRTFPMLAPLVSRILAVVAVCAASVAAASAQPSSGIVVDGHPRCVINVDAKTQSGPPAKTLTLRLDGGLAFECLRIEPGRFMMGAPDSDKDALPEEKPQREVRIETLLADPHRRVG